MFTKTIIISLFISGSIALELDKDFAQPLPDIEVINQESIVGVENEQKLSVCEIKKQPVEEMIETTTYSIPDYPGKKSFMGYDVFKSGSKQEELQEMAITDSEGFRRVKDRYCVAIGEHFSPVIGQYIDLVLDDGRIINCIIGDIKAKDDTDSTDMFSLNGCCSEFIVELTQLNKRVKKSGDVSSLDDQWEPQVRYIIRYDKNVFKED